MSQLELLAAPLAWHTWRSKLQDSSALLFIDNNGAAANLVKGYSPQVDSSAIVGHFWLLASSMKSSVYIDRVESKSNPADGPSRLDVSWLSHHGSLWTPPQIGHLRRPLIDPALWFGATTVNGGKRVTPPTISGGRMWRQRILLPLGRSLWASSLHLRLGWVGEIPKMITG